MDVRVEFVYVARAADEWTAANPVFIGPQFDLPLKRITWQLHVPEQFIYDDFRGTMTVNQQLIDSQQIEAYGLRDYDAQVYTFNRTNYEYARSAQVKGEQLMRDGEQKRAQQAFEAAVHYSAFSEDARVKLHQFNDDNALVGLVGARQRLREQADGGNRAADEAPARFNTETIDRIKSSLSKADSENLQHLTRNWTQVQAKAAGETVQLAVNMPYRGRVLQFERSVQVKENTPMQVEFSAEPMRESAASVTRWWIVGLIFGFAMFCLLITTLSRHWTSLPAALHVESEEEADDEDESDGEPEAAKSDEKTDV